MNFPSAPSLGQEYTFGGHKWVFNGIGWAKIAIIPLENVEGLVAALAGKQASGSYASSTQGGKADTALQPAAIGTTVQAYKAVLESTTASFTTALNTKLTGIATGATKNATDAQLRDRDTHTGSQAMSTVTGLVAALADKEDAANKGAANGYASLGADGKIPSAQLPAIAITDTFAVATQAAMLALTAQKGDVAVRTDLNKSFILRVEPATALANWQEMLTPTDAVLSVNGQSGAVSLTKTDVGLGNVANKSEAQLVASGEVATALAAKTDNSRFTISTADPSGGANGDIWFKV